MNDAENYYNSFGDMYELVWSENIHMGLFSGTDDLKIACQKMTEFLAKFAEVKKDSKILNIGCGRGGTDRYLAQKYNASIVAIDISQKQIDIATIRAAESNLQKSITYIQADMDKLNFKDQNFDLIWMDESLGYSRQKLKTLKYLSSILNKPGKILIEDVILMDEKYRHEVAVMFGSRSKIDDLMTKDQYLALIKDGGFKVIKSEDLSANVAKTYQKVNEYINNNRGLIKLKTPAIYADKLKDNFNFPLSQQLAEQGKIGCFTVLVELKS